MKLFTYACLAGAGSAQSGDYDDRQITSDYYEAVASSDYYEYDEFGNKKNKNKNKWFDQDQKFGLEVYTDSTAVNPNTKYWDWATALNCWPANIEADQLVYSNQLMSGQDGRVEASYLAGGDANPELYPSQTYHMKAPQHVYGSYEILERAHDASRDASITQLTNQNLGDNDTNQTGLDHLKNGWFAGHGEEAGATDNLNLHQEDPVLRSGLGGLYQYGHDTYDSSAHNMDMDFSLKTEASLATVATTAIRWTHYKQARHAGCLYEKAEWHYGYGTYEQIHLATYFQGYGSFDMRSATNANWFPAWDKDASTDLWDTYGANQVEPIWWHFFNAHILPNPQNSLCAGDNQFAFNTADDPDASINGKNPQSTLKSYACPTVPNGQLLPGAGAGAETTGSTGFTTNATGDSWLQPETSHSIPLVMANPAYEGLGYLNFIVEYKNKMRDVGEDYLEFIDSTPSMSGASEYDGSANNYSGFRGLNTYREINNCQAQTFDGNTATDGNFSDGVADSSQANEQECTGWGENLGNWSGVHGMFYYDLYMGSWLVYPAIGDTTSDTTGNTADNVHYRTWVLYPFSGSATYTPVVFDVTNAAANWASTVTEWMMSTWEGHQAATGTTAVSWSDKHDLVVSSFPHNNLGKDFRFNLRVLQGALTSTAVTASATTGATVEFFDETKLAANQIYRSYYFYKINQIDIRFPYYVAYALHHENRGMEGNTARTATRDRTHDGTADIDGVTDVLQRTIDWNGWGTNNAAGQKTTEWGGDRTAIATALPGGGVVADTPTSWCENDLQCSPLGQQWWNTLNNDIVHPLTYNGDPHTAGTKLYKHMDTTTLLAFNRNPMSTRQELDDYQFMHVSAAHLRSNIIPPVDLGTHSPGVTKHGVDATSGNNTGGAVEFHRIMGYIKKVDATDGTAANSAGVIGAADAEKYIAADWCDFTGGTWTDATTADGTQGENILERTCGIDFRIVGLMNTYDERRGQRGTYQEIWVQLQYALGKGGRDGYLSACQKTATDDAAAPEGNWNGDPDCTITNHPIQSPHPYLHFMASEIIHIQATCNTINVNNPNTCGMMNYGPGYANNAAYGGK